MPSAFETAWAARRNDLLSRFREIEMFLWTPQTAPIVLIGGVSAPDVNGDTVDDPSRSAGTISGVFVEKGAILHAHGRSMADATTRPIVADAPTLIVQLDELSEPLIPRDLIERQRTGERFAIAKILPQQFSRGYAHLVRCS